MKTSPSPQQNTQVLQPVINEIVVQVNSLSQALTNMNKKMNASDKDLK